MMGSRLCTNYPKSANRQNEKDEDLCTIDGQKVTMLGCPVTAASEEAFVCQRHDAFCCPISVGDTLPRCCIWSNADDHSDIGLERLGRKDPDLAIACLLGDCRQAILVRATGSGARGAGIFHASRKQSSQEQAWNEFKYCVHVVAFIGRYVSCIVRRCNRRIRSSFVPYR